MFLNHIHFRSHVLGYQQKLLIMLPQGQDGRILPGKLKCLTLLHGLSDDETAWMRWSNIEKYAEKYGIAVVMPAVEKSFYSNMVYGDRFADYISEEVPAFLRGFLPLSGQREDNYIAGISMGGYGALKIALSNPTSYCATASLSGVVDIADFLSQPEITENKEFFHDISLVFGDITKLKDTKNDLLRLIVDGMVKDYLPRIYQCCGTEDFLYQNNLIFRDKVSELDIDHYYEDGPGDHLWSYWDTMIQKVFPWFGLKELEPI